MGSGLSITKRIAVKTAKQEFAEQIMAKFDVTKSGTLNREEVFAMCKGIVEDIAPLAEVTESDVDDIMSVADHDHKGSINEREIPDALSVILALKAESISQHDLFLKYDCDNTGKLRKEQLPDYVFDFTDGHMVGDADMSYILQHCAYDDAEGGVGEAKIKAAISAWYCLCNAPPPETIEEAKAAGYTDEQINEYIYTQENKDVAVPISEEPDSKSLNAPSVSAPVTETTVTTPTEAAGSTETTPSFATDAPSAESNADTESATET